MDADDIHAVLADPVAQRLSRRGTLAPSV